MADLSPELLAALGVSEQPKGKSSSLKRGVGQMYAEVGQTVSDITGGAVGKGMLETGQEIARANPAEVTEPGQILQKPGTFLSETFGEQLPRMVLPVLGGVGGALVGGPVGAVAGFAGGAALPSLVAEYGGIRQEQLEEGKVDSKGRALAAAVPAAALDVATGMVPMLGRMGKGFVDKGARAVADKTLKGTAKAAGKAAVTEGGVEGVQTVVEREGAAQDKFSSEGVNDIVMSALKGATAGGGVGAVANVLSPADRARIKQEAEIQKEDIKRHLQLEPGLTTTVNVSSLDMEAGAPVPGESEADIGGGKTAVDLETGAKKTPVDLDVTGQGPIPAMDIPLAGAKATPLDLNLAQQQPLDLEVDAGRTPIDIAPGKPRTPVDIRLGGKTKVDLGLGEPGTAAAVDVGAAPSFKGLPPKLVKDLGGKTPEEQGKILLDKFNAIGREAAPQMYAEKIPAIYKAVTGKEIPSEEITAKAARSAAPAKVSGGAQPQSGPGQRQAEAPQGAVAEAQPTQAGSPAQQVTEVADVARVAQPTEAPAAGPAGDAQAASPVVPAVAPVVAGGGVVAAPARDDKSKRGGRVPKQPASGVADNRDQGVAPAAPLTFAQQRKEANAEKSAKAKAVISDLGLGEPAGKEAENAVQEPSAAPVPVREKPKRGKGVRKQDAEGSQAAGAQETQTGNASTQKGQEPEVAVQEIPAKKEREKKDSLAPKKTTRDVEGPETFATSGPASRTLEEAQKSGGRILVDWWNDLAWAVRNKNSLSLATQRLANKILDDGKVRDQDIARAEVMAKKVSEIQSTNESKALAQREKMNAKAAQVKADTKQQFKDEAAAAEAEKAAARKAKQDEALKGNRAERRAALARSAWEIKQPDGTWVPDSNVRDVKFERGRATVIFADGTTGVFNRSDVRKTKKFKKDVTPVDPRDRVDAESAWDGSDLGPEYDKLIYNSVEQQGFEVGTERALREKADARGEMSAVDALEAVVATSANNPNMTPEMVDVAKSMLATAKALGLKTRVVISSHKDAIVPSSKKEHGTYYSEMDIVELLDASDNWSSNDEKLWGTSHGLNAYTVMHEVGHALTVAEMRRGEAINLNPAGPRNADEQRVEDAHRAISEIWQYLYTKHGRKLDEDNGDFYGLTNPREMVTEAFTNANFQTWLKSVVLPDSIRAKVSGLNGISVPTVWDAFVNAIRKFLGLGPNANNALSDVLDVSRHFGTTNAPFGVNMKMRNVALTERSNFRGVWKSRMGNPTADKLVNGIGPGVDALAATGKDMNEFDRALASVPFRKLLSLKDKTVKALLQAVSLKGMVFQFSKRFPVLQRYANAVDAMRNEATSRNNESSKLLNHLRKWIERNGGWSPQDADSNKKASIMFRLMEESTLLNKDPRTKIEEQAEFTDAVVHGRQGEKWESFAKDYQTVTNLYAQLDGEGKKIYGDMLDHNRKMYDDLYEQMVHNIIRTMGDVKEQQGVSVATLAKNLRQNIYGKDAAAAFMQLERDHARVKGPYFHLGRYGDYAIRYGTAEKHSFETFEDYGQFAARVAELKAQNKHLGPDGKQTETWMAGKMAENVAQLDTGSWKFVRSMIERIDGHPDLDDTQRETMKHAVRQMYLQMLPETSSRKVFAKRKGVAGWDRDMMRNFAKRAEIANYNLAQAKHAVEVSDSLGEIKKQVTELEHTNPKEAVLGRHIEDEIRQRQSDRMRTPFTPVIDKINALTYNFYLAFSPAYILTNMMQPWHITLPMIGSKFGMTKTAIEMARNSRVAFSAIKQMWKQDWKYPDIAVDKIDGLSADQKSFLKSAVASGRIDITLAHELGEVKKQGGVSKLNDWQHVFGLGSHYSEVMNRVTAGMTAFNLAKQSGMELGKAIEYGNRIIDETQYDYSSENLARIMGKQGVFGTITPLFMAFQRYNAQTLELVTRLVQNALGLGEGKLATGPEKAEARRALAGLLATTGSFAGMLGLPFANMVFASLDKLFGDDDDPLDSKSEFRNMLAGVFGKDMGEVIAHGGPRALGVNMSRVGLQDLMPFTKMMSDKRKLKDMVEANAVDAMGPAMGGITNMLLGANQVANGDVGAGLAKLFPLALGRNISKAAEISNGYAVDAKGNQIPLALNSWDVFNQALGLTPPKVAERSEAQFAINSQDRQLQNAATTLRTSMFRAMEREDVERIAELQSKILEFNQRHPMYAVTGVGRGYAQREKEKAVAATMGPGVGVRAIKKLPKLDIGGFANVRDEEED